MSTHAKFEFRLVDEDKLNSAVDILKTRLPKSSNVRLRLDLSNFIVSSRLIISILHIIPIQVYNMVKMSFNLKSKIQVYYMEGTGADTETLPDDCIILVNTFREEVDQEISISIPPGEFDKFNFQDSLSNTSAIDWGKSYEFVCIDRSITPIVFEVSTHVKGNLTHCNPCYAYVVDNPQEFFHENIINNQAVLKQIDLQGGLEFMFKNWKYSEEKTKDYLARILQKLPSGGVYIDERIVSGVVQNSNGVIGMLFTRPEERNKGYGVSVMRYLIKEIFQAGLSPCSVAEMRNIASQKLHEKVGMQKSHEVDYIWYMNK